MPRTTVDIDASILRALKRRQKRERKTLGELVSELLAAALVDDPAGSSPGPLRWTSREMRARVDLEDKEAIRRLVDEG